MNEHGEPLPPAPELEAPPLDMPARRKGWTKLAWCVIILEVGAIIAFRMFAPAPVEQAHKLAARIDLKALQLQMQLGVALRSDDLYTSTEQQADDDPAKLLLVSALAADMVGPQEALKQLDKIPQNLQQAHERVIAVLRRLYNDQARGEFDHPAVKDEDAEFLEQELGWAGALALYPAMAEPTLQARAAALGARGPTVLEQYREGRERVLNAGQTTMIVLFTFSGMAVSVLALGLIGLPLFLFLWVIGVVRIGLKPGITHEGVYAETFALWLFLYSALLIVSELLFHDVSIAVRGSISMPLSLIVLAWPVLRGVPWRQVRHDIGWTFGRTPLLEPVCGLICYAVNLPFVFAGFLITLLLTAALAALQSHTGAGEPTPPTHPIVEQLGRMDWLNLLLLAVVAPFVEETMFRGLLHRHLRERLFVRQPLLGGVCSAVIVNLIFASIHPQGLLFVPVLGALACGFSLAREWRGTLIPSMVAHGTHNFVVGLVAILLFAR